MASTEVAPPPPVVKGVKKSGSTPKKAKPAGARKPRPEPLHPSYLQMSSEAIAALKERTGSSQVAIVKYIEGKYKNVLPANFKKILSVQLKNLVKQGKLIKVKASYKLSDEVKKQVAPKRAKKVKEGEASTKKVTKKASVKPKAAPKKAKSPKKVKSAKKAAPKASKPAKAALVTSKAKPAAAKKPASKKPATKKRATKSTLKPKSATKPAVKSAAKAPAKKPAAKPKAKAPAKSPKAKKPVAKKAKKV